MARSVMVRTIMARTIMAERTSLPPVVLDGDGRGCDRGLLTRQRFNANGIGAVVDAVVAIVTTTMASPIAMAAFEGNNHG